MIKNLVVFTEGISCEYVLNLGGCGSIGEFFNGRHKPVGVMKIFVKESEKHVAAFFSIVRIHCDFPEKIFYLRVDHCEGAEAVPEVVEHIECFGI